MSVREALYKRLSEDPVLAEIANAVLHRELDKESREAGIAPPVVIFSKATGDPFWTFEGDPMDMERWLIKGVGSSKEAEAIDTRCKAILTPDGTLAIAGKVNQDLRRMSDVNYAEVVEGERLDHIGAEYKVDSEAT